ncbi:hypothetical protein [Sphingomonas sp.]|uniref:hypothetical protein n=1 Tax=Sphingomonas sp. TaxID=28214 RepID=UPI001B0BC726|nr:hypothetical protein [Sphingomonas sp.]MBO9711317.1 hypothetical protein [Sphingomonas sp.]
MANPVSFDQLQNGFYNALAAGLGYETTTPFQVVQPSPPLVGGAGADGRLWNYLDIIPPATLNMNIALGAGGNKFSADYQGVLSALQPANELFPKTVGDACYGNWATARSKNQVGPTGQDFQLWAYGSTPCQTVARQGAIALNRDNLDPIFVAQNNAMPYQPAGTQPITFSIDYNTMVQLLMSAPSRSFNVAQGNWQTDVSKTWTNGSTGGFFGLWGGSSSSSTISQKFASSGVSLQASFANVLPFTTSPGIWFSSAALGLAYHNPNAAPWDPNSTINWDNTFGTNGNMQRFTTTLLIANKMEILVQSVASYTETEQTEIRNNSSAGLWPFYSSSGSSGSSTYASFNAQGNLTVSITSDAGVPVVIGAIVESAAGYLGSEVEAAKFLTRTLFEQSARERVLEPS